MKRQTNTSIVERLFKEQANQNDVSLYEEFFTSNVLLHGPASHQTVQGVQNIKALDQSYIQAYPQKKFTFENITETQDQVFVRWRCDGTLKISNQPLITQSSTFSIAGLSIYRLYNQKICEIWQYWDRLALLEQENTLSTFSEVQIEHHLNLLRSLKIEECLERIHLLSTRERQCLRSLLEGKTAKETAWIYQLSPRTIESYFENIKKKLHCPTKQDLKTLAYVLDKLSLL